MMKTTAAAAAVASFLLLGCHRQPASAAAQAAQATPAIARESPETLGRIGAEISKHPGDAKRILSKYEMDEISFLKAIRAVSSDTVLSRRYRDGFRKTR